jgi:BirA family transcriptional regulator, biotin operon repressor / biotin---[acetyl-CoA-carboxylase] ligase
MSTADDARIHRLLDLLTDHPTMVLSGSKMATELGTPRSTLRGWILRLRDLGVDLEGVPLSGYRLKRMPELLTPRAIRRAAQWTPFGQRAIHHFKTGSTMNDAAALAAAGEPHGTIVVAEEQTAGRGRLGRTWHSEKGAGLYFSMVLRPPLPAAAAPMLTLVSGLAVREAIAEITGRAFPETDLRWPNDVLLRGSKCAGILLEMTAEPERIKYVILGVGINVNQSEMPTDLDNSATSLRIACGHPFVRADVLGTVLRALDRSLSRLLAPNGRAATVEEFEKHSSFARGRRVEISEGGEDVQGVTEGLDHAGYLLLRRDDTGAVEPIYTGRVRPLEAER